MILMSVKTMTTISNTRTKTILKVSVLDSRLACDGEEAVNRTAFLCKHG
jgi:hypothetical protein